MAYYDNNPYDNDFDGNPGSDEYSAAYDRKYNRDGYNEFTNLPEIDERQEIARYEQQAGEYDFLTLSAGLREAMKRVQYWPHAGRFIVPRENSYVAHLNLVREGNTVDIQFDPKTYLYFDKVIKEHANKPELFNPNHPDYFEYTTLRENLAVLRNDIMGMYMDDGSFDPGDEKYLPRLAQIAAEIGDALNADNSWKKAVFRSLDTNIANIEGEGAAYIYEYLVKNRQVNSQTIGGKIWGFVRRFMGQADNQWQLPAIEYTAFSQENLSKMPPSDELTNLTTHELRQIAAAHAEELKAILDPTDEASIRDVSMMQRREAIRHGHTIIDWLKNIRFTDKSLQDMIDSGRPGEPNPERDAMAMMVSGYKLIMQQAVEDNPELLANPKIQEANAVVDNVEHSMQIMAKLEKPHSQEDAMDIGSDITRQPERWHELSKVAVDKLMERLKVALQEAVAEMELNQQEMQLAQEAFASQQVEDAMAMQQSYNAKRARKQKGPTNQQRIDMALRADDRAAGQGAYSDQDEEGVRIAKQKARQMSAAAPALGMSSPALPSKQGDGAVNNDRNKAADEKDESMEAKIAAAKALGLDKAQPSKMNMPKMGVNDKLVKQLGKQLMAMQQQANVAASEIADVKGGGIGTGETFKERKERQPTSQKPKMF